jgi:hypothetical protein
MVAAAAVIRDKLNQRQGPGMGDWCSVIEELGGRRFAAIDDLRVPDFDGDQPVWVRPSVSAIVFTRG